MSVKTISKDENEINSLEKKILESKQRLAELRRNQPPEEVADYLLTESKGDIAKLSDLFGAHNELILIHNMGKTCPYCTMWADGFNGLREHLENRAGFAVVSPDNPETQREFASGRGWKFKMYSAMGTSFIKDLGFEDEKGDYWPGVSTFAKKDGKIYRIAKDFFGPHDNYCSAWHFFDLLPEGVSGWQPKFNYEN
jgi:predicted dithiol-disulfide oxidoreductase (DUF899 family)